MIRVWRVNSLADELRAGSVSETDKLYYVFASAALQYLVGPASLLSNPTWETLAWNAVAMAVAFVGLSLAFAANGGETGSSFIERYFCLSLPITVRIYGVGYGVYYVAWIVAVILWPAFQAHVSVQRMVSVAYGVMMVIAYFIMLCRAMKRVAVSE